MNQPENGSPADDALRRAQRRVWWLLLVPAAIQAWIIAYKLADVIESPWWLVFMPAIITVLVLGAGKLLLFVADGDWDR